MWQRHVWRVLVAICVVGGINGASAWWVIDTPMTGTCAGVATFVDDPDVAPHYMSAVVKIDGVRYRANAYGMASRKLKSRLMGEQVFVEGTCREISGRFRDWDRQRHILGRITIENVREEFSSGSALYRSANRLRRHIASGIQSMHPGDRALFTGLVMGDDRDQPQSMIDSFRASGLSHLVAVSGQNVAYVLAAIGPLLRSRRLAMRLVLTCAVLAWFVVLTRAEPSVVRAAVMAGIVAVSFAFGRSTSTKVVLCVTAISLLCVDPMMARSVGFLLSTGATAGLAWLLPVTSRIVGRGGVRDVVAATLAATMGTAPLSLFFFQNLPIVSMFANPFAVPIAGAVMLIGLPTSLIVPVLPDPLQSLLVFTLEIPVRLLWWIAVTCGAISPKGILNALCWCLLVALCVTRYRRNAHVISVQADSASRVTDVKK
jgi:competence protein ComEC